MKSKFTYLKNLFKSIWNPNKFPNWKDDIPPSKPFPKPTGKLFYIDFKYEKNKDDQIEDELTDLLLKNIKKESK